MATLTGYGPSSQWQNLAFDGDKRKFEIWEVKILGCMKLRKLKETLVGTEEIDANKNETAFAELIQFLDERSLSLVIREAKDDGRKAFQILRIKATPYGLITGVKPNVAKLHIFGTTCYAYLHGQTKLDPHSRKGYVLGMIETVQLTLFTILKTGQLPSSVL